MIAKKINLIKNILSTPSFKDGVTEDGFYVINYSNNIRENLFSLSMNYKEIFVIAKKIDIKIPSFMNGATISLVLKNQ